MRHLPTFQMNAIEVIPVDVVNMKLASWFPHEHIAVNVRTIIRTIATSSPEYQLNSENSSKFIIFIENVLVCCFFLRFCRLAFIIIFPVDVFKWKTVPECTDLYPAGRASMRHVLDTRSFGHDYDSIVAASSSAPLLPARMLFCYVVNVFGCVSHYVYALFYNLLIHRYQRS